MHSWYSTPPPRILGHRGAAGVAPENTLPSFALALALGADILEMDVHGSRDGVVVVMHDDTVDRTTDGTGKVRDLSWRQIEALDAGYHFSRDGRDFPFRGHGVKVPTLEGVLSTFPLAVCNVEIKENDGALIDEVIAMIRRLDARSRVLLAAENGAILEHVRGHADDIATSFSAQDVAEFLTRVDSGNWAGYAPRGIALQVPVRVGEIEIVRPEVIAASHRFGLEVHAWTINDPDDMHELWNRGVDGIVSDLPGLARVVARKCFGGG
jgi:glycerophosphoryl diester phosphodiesterase